MQLVLAQLASREGDVAHNLGRALEVVHAADDGTALIVFPETHLSGFAEPEHVLDRALTLDGPELEALIEASRERDLAIAIGLLERDGEIVFNTTVLITPESGIALRYRKTHLWPDERTLVEPGDALHCLEWRGRCIGLLICYDLEFPEPARALAAMGADLLVVTNGNMDPYGPIHARAAQVRAQENQCFLAMSNRVGQGAGLIFAGESALIGPDGEALFRAGREETIQPLHLDPARLSSARQDYDYHGDRRLSLQGQLETQGSQRSWHFG
ncbi:carbon-nitrogen hydrolase family protein [Salinicola socius]|uniref:Carbon-nitrogen hydrolase n=1 Tax=Salinicola socius TaxID=404433 RepID=A0A1Q8STY4_9GAMM|nr:carbon-nitrogen hydrolase family protein [Salinicola socius]OLO04884.1 carbon-nitrogen hydrolase [Salinicola socius]